MPKRNPLERCEPELSALGVNDRRLAPKPAPTLAEGQFAERAHEFALARRVGRQRRIRQHLWRFNRTAGAQFRLPFSASPNWAGQSRLRRGRSPDWRAAQRGEEALKAEVRSRLSARYRILSQRSASASHLDPLGPLAPRW